jgi:LEA14-like dessication related protein
MHIKKIPYQDKYNDLMIGEGDKFKIVEAGDDGGVEWFKVHLQLNESSLETSHPTNILVGSRDPINNFKKIIMRMLKIHLTSAGLIIKRNWEDESAFAVFEIIKYP